MGDEFDVDALLEAAYVSKAVSKTFMFHLLAVNY